MDGEVGDERRMRGPEGEVDGVAVAGEALGGGGVGAVVGVDEGVEDDQLWGRIAAVVAVGAVRREP